MEHDTTQSDCYDPCRLHTSPFDNKSHENIYLPIHELYSDTKSHKSGD